jgi:hypothetical protein
MQHAFGVEAGDLSRNITLHQLADSSHVMLEINACLFCHERWIGRNAINQAECGAFTNFIQVCRV